MELSQAAKIASVGLDMLFQAPLKKLRQQLTHVDCLNISDLNSAGFFVDFKFMEVGAEKLAVTPSKFYLGDLKVSNEQPFESSIVDYILFIENGLLNMLEVSFIDVPDNYDISGAQMSYIEIPRHLPF